MQLATVPTPETAPVVTGPSVAVPKGHISVPEASVLEAVVTRARCFPRAGMPHPGASPSGGPARAGRSTPPRARSTP